MCLKAALRDSFWLVLSFDSSYSVVHSARNDFLSVHIPWCVVVTDRRFWAGGEDGGWRYHDHHLRDAAVRRPRSHQGPTTLLATAKISPLFFHLSSSTPQFEVCCSSGGAMTELINVQPLQHAQNSRGLGAMNSFVLHPVPSGSALSKAMLSCTEMLPPSDCSTPAAAPTPFTGCAVHAAVSATPPCPSLHPFCRMLPRNASCCR